MPTCQTGWDRGSGGMTVRVAGFSLAGFEASAQEGRHAWHRTPSQKMWGKGHWSRARLEPAAVVLLGGHVVQLPSKYVHLYP